MMRSYLRIDGVAGGCSEGGYEGWIDCDAVSWSLHGPGRQSEIRFVKPEDTASPVLARMCVSGTRAARAHFDFLRAGAGGERIKCYEIELEDVLVAQVATGPRREPPSTETVVLTFAHARLVSYERNPPGQAGGA